MTQKFSSVEDFLALLQRVKQQPAGGWKASCPCPTHKHGDRSPSLKIDLNDKTILVKCYAGDSADEIMAALGLDKSCLFLEGAASSNGPRSQPKPEPEPQPGPKAEFTPTPADVERMQMALAKSQAARDYIERRGISLKIATDLKWGFAERAFDDGKQHPALAHPHYQQSKLVGISFRSIDGPTKSRFTQAAGSSIDGLYGDPGIAADVHIFEGPLDIALARTFGLNACGYLSAISKPLTPDIQLLSIFDRIFLVGDQDMPGKKLMDDLQPRLPAEQSIRVRLSGFKDVGEIYNDAPTAFPKRMAGILRLARASRDYFELEDLFTAREIAEGVADLEPCIVAKLFPRGAISMLYGQEKNGKSILTYYIAKCVANGVKVFGKYETVKTPVLYLDLENSDQDIENFQKLFARVGPEEVHYRNRKTTVPTLASPGFLRFCEKYKPLVILDSLTKHTPPGADPFNPRDMSQFSDLMLNACAAGATIIMIHHSTRADDERYANSYAIGAGVVRSFCVISLDRPKLGQVRLEGKLFRGDAPVSENLIAFPVITEQGCFGIADSSNPFERMISFVDEQPDKMCTTTQLRKFMRRRKDTVLEMVRKAVATQRLAWDEKTGIISIYYNIGNVGSQTGNRLFEHAGSQTGNQPGTGQEETDEDE